jgi:hypothetical protein
MKLLRSGFEIKFYRCVIPCKSSLRTGGLMIGGTCAMKSREKGGVVDGNLSVYGTSNLKVAGMCFVEMRY